MCGIVGYIGNKKALPLLLTSLKKLEYRGYDSAGVALLEENGNVGVFRAEGKLLNLETKIKEVKSESTFGIGHTRWATHGRPSEANAHPHRCGRVVLVHNGIIENYAELKLTLPQKGKELKSETDSEILCHLLDHEISKTGDFLKAFQNLLQKITGTYSLVVMDTQNPDAFFVAKKSSPLVVGFGEGEMFIASDVPALLPFTKKVAYLENGDIGILSREGIFTLSLNPSPIKGEGNYSEVKRPVSTITWDADTAEKGGYPHFMLKEIFEQPQSVAHTLLGRVDSARQTIHLKELDSLFEKKSLDSFTRIYIVACGTSWHSAMAGRYFIEAIAKVSVAVDTASEFRYREPFIDTNTLLIAVSQSGETADTLACVQEAREKGAKIVSICNVVESSIPRSSDVSLYTYAGPEIGVASTKAFTTQLVMFLMLALDWARRQKSIDEKYLKTALTALSVLPEKMEKILARRNEIKKLAEKYAWKKEPASSARDEGEALQALPVEGATRVPINDFYYMARGVEFPIALEGALKLKEISYIHAEGYAAGEMKHGPLALIEPGTPVVALAPQDRVCEKIISNIHEVEARGGKVIVFATENDTRFDPKKEDIFFIPKAVWYINPLLISLPLQMLAYEIAALRGAEIDQPRNLAKSVTVE